MAEAEQLRFSCTTCGGAGRLTAGVVVGTGQERSSRTGPNDWPARMVTSYRFPRPCPECAEPTSRDEWLVAVREAWQAEP